MGSEAASTEASRLHLGDVRHMVQTTLFKGVSKSQYLQSEQRIQEINMLGNKGNKKLHSCEKMLKVEMFGKCEGKCLEWVRSGTHLHVTKQRQYQTMNDLCLCQNSALCSSVSIAPSLLQSLLVTSCCSLHAPFSSTSTQTPLFGACVTHSIRFGHQKRANRIQSSFIRPPPHSLLSSYQGAQSCFSHSCINNPSCGHTCSQTLQTHRLKTRSLRLRKNEKIVWNELIFYQLFISYFITCMN